VKSQSAASSSSQRNEQLGNHADKGSKTGSALPCNREALRRTDEALVRSNEDRCREALPGTDRRAAYPELKLVIAWNQPILRTEKDHVFGASALKKYLLINPFSKAVIDTFTPKMKELRVLKHSITIPNDWEIDEKLLLAMAKARIKEIG